MPTRNQLARVHIAKKELKLTDSLYRDFLELWFGKRSSKNFTSDEIEALLTHFKGLGWEQFRSAPQNPLLASPAQLYKIQKLWMTGPGVRVKTLAALKHFLSHHFHISSLAAVKAAQVGSIFGAIRKIAEGPAPSAGPEKTSKPQNNTILF
ncbi:MAG: regulatory protein GemA [Nitrospinae bacterium]|jgi:hypothetical protein|nr:regulatory protein GemA [Nitrospinota bacterium]MDA1109879.1 regulatory protein GemA [Nitrospinota bacterium]